MGAYFFTAYFQTAGLSLVGGLAFAVNWTGNYSL